MVSGVTREDFQKIIQDLGRQQLIKKGFDPDVQEKFFRDIGFPIPGSRSTGTAGGRVISGGVPVAGKTDFQIAQEREAERRRIEAENRRKLEEIKRKQREEAKRQASLTQAQRLAERNLRRKLQVQFQVELNRQARSKGRNLSLSERESIAKKVFETEVSKRARLQEEIRKRQRPLTNQELNSLQQFRNLLTRQGITEKTFFKQIVPGSTRSPAPKRIQKIINKLSKTQFEELFRIPVARFGVSGLTKQESFAIRDLTRFTFKQLERRGLSKKRIAELTSLSNKQIDRLPNLSPKERANLKKLSRLQREIGIGALEGIQENPGKIIATAFLSGLSPAIIAKLGGHARVVALLNKIPEKVKRRGAVAIQKALMGAYLSSVGLRVASAEEGKRAKKFGQILATEVAPFEIGTRVGIKGLLRKELQSEINESIKGMSKQRRIAFKEYMKQAETFGKYEPKAKNIKLNNIESIPNPKAQKVVRKFLKNSKGNVIVGGSVAQTGQIKVTRKLGDMDLYIERGSISTQANNLARQLKRAGIKRVSSIRGQVTIEGRKAIEIHKIDRLLANIEQVTPLWARARGYIIKTPEGIRIQRIGIQARRKVVASFADPKRLATGKYKKDLKDFKKISEAIFKQASKKANASFFLKKKKIKKIEKIFKKKVKKIKITKKLKKPKKLKRISKVHKKAKARITRAKKKARVIRGKGKPKISKKQLMKIKRRKLKAKKLKKLRRKKKLIRQRKLKERRKKFRPSQKKIKKRFKPSQARVRKKFKPSQVKVKKRKKFRPSQKPPKKRKKFRPSQKPPKKPFRPSQPPRKPTRRFPPSQPPVRPPRRPPRVPKPPKKPPLIPTIKLKNFKKKRLSKSQPVFFVKEKIRGKVVNLTPKPLTLRDAKDFLAFRLDNRLSRSGWFEPIGKSKNVLLPPKVMRGYFQKNKRKFRPFKIRVGKKRLIRNGYIERKKFIGDTRTEIKQLQASRKKKRKIKKRVVKRKFKRNNIRKGNQNRNGKRRRPIKRIKKKIIRRKMKKKTRVKKNPVRRRGKLNSKQKRKARLQRKKQLKKKRQKRRRFKTRVVRRKGSVKRIVIKKRIVKRKPRKKKQVKRKPVKKRRKKKRR